MKISVITVSFNSIKTIVKSIESVQAQENVEIEHIFIDGGSTDGTVNVITEMLRDNDIFISEQDDGIYNAMNKGVNIATGDIVAILNSDDVFYDCNTLNTVAEIFTDNSVDVVYSNIVYTNLEGKQLGYWCPGSFESKRFSEGWHPPHPGFFCRKYCYEQGGNFDENLKIAADFDIMLRFFEVLKFRSKYLDQYTVKMYNGGASAQFSAILQGFRDIQCAFQKYDISVGIIYFLSRYFKKILRKLQF